MKVLMINGSPRKGSNTGLALAEMEKVFAAEGIEVETVTIGGKDVRGCIACGTCGKRGACVFDDVVNECAPKFEEADGLVVGTPVYYGQPNGGILSLMQRLFFSAGHLVQNKPAAALAVCRRGCTQARRTSPVHELYQIINEVDGTIR